MSAQAGGGRRCRYPGHQRYGGPHQGVDHPTGDLRHVDGVRLVQPLDLQPVHHRDQRRRGLLDVRRSLEVPVAGAIDDRRRDQCPQPLIPVEEPGAGGMRFGGSLDGQHRVHLGGHRPRHVAGHGVHQVLQQLPATRRLTTGRLLQAEEIPLLEELDEQGLLGLEVVQESGGCDARGTGHVGQRRLVEALLTEGHQGRVEDLLLADPGAPGVDPLGFAVVRPPGR